MTIKIYTVLFNSIPKRGALHHILTMQGEGLAHRKQDLQ